MIYYFITLKLKQTLSYRKFYTAGVGLIKGDEAMKKDYDKTSSFKILHAGLENAPQTTLQMYIIISTWGSTGKQINDTKSIYHGNQVATIRSICGHPMCAYPHTSRGALHECT